jgi:hypothetical protein
MTCVDCGERFAHCHGTLVLHADVAECTDPACDTNLASHALVVGCAEVDCSSCAAARTAA